MTCPHLIDVGAYVIDALEPEERLGLEAHLATCRTCAAAVRELEGLPARLASVPPPQAPAPVPAPSELAFLRLQRSALAVPASRAPARRRPVARRWALVAAAMVVLGGAGTAGVVVSSGGSDAPAILAVSEGDLHVRAAMTEESSGTRIVMALVGGTPGQQCELAVQARDGHWETAGTWTASHAGSAHVSGTVRIDPEDVTRVVVRTLDGRLLVSMPA
jgi:anti-sigma-K factor RskA